MKKTTAELLELIKKSPNISNYIKSASEDLIPLVPLHIYLNQILIEKGLKKSEVIHNSGLDRSYAYEIFSGEKKPNRDKVLSLCFALSLNAQESQKLLKSTGYPPLYARLKRDSIILFSLTHLLSLTETNELLYEMNFPLLE